MNILILSPYDAPSHRYWHQGLVAQLKQHVCTVISLAPRYFSWRFRGNSLTLSQDERLHGGYDLIIATSMTDLSALKGMCPAISKLPSILYFHENQFAYPDAGKESHLIERQITSVYAAISADCLVFNSEFNRSTFLAGTRQLFAKLPDGIPEGIPEQLEEKSQLIAVALQPWPQPAGANQEPAGPSQQKSDQFSIIWNHRWEHDKGLDELEAMVDLLLASKVVFQFHLIGQSFRHVPASIERTLAKLKRADCLGYAGFIDDRDEYLALLSSSHVVLSSARHEFQGLSVLEAMQAGCAPVVPDDLAYKEFVAAPNRYGNSQAGFLLIEAMYQRWRDIVKDTGTDVGNKDSSSTLSHGLPETVQWSRVATLWQGLVSEYE